MVTANTKVSRGPQPWAACINAFVHAAVLSNSKAKMIAICAGGYLRLSPAQIATVLSMSVPFFLLPFPPLEAREEHGETPKTSSIRGRFFLEFHVVGGSLR